MSKRVLVVEDDPHIRLGICDALRGDGFEVSECGDGGAALASVRAFQPDLLILDIMLPHVSGYDLCREIRSTRNRLPILMLSAKGQEIDKVVGLELGADDYVTKPFSVRELIARVHALLRRAAPVSSSGEVPEFLRFGEVEIHCKALRGTRDGTEFELTPRELKVLAYLHGELGNAVSRDALLNYAWGISYYGTTRTLDQVIVKLRQKIERDPSNPKCLLTVHGLGYRLESA